MNNLEAEPTFQKSVPEKNINQEADPTIENTSEKIENKSEQVLQEETIAEYQKENIEIAEKINSAIEQKEVLINSLKEVRNDIYAGDIPQNISDPSIEAIDDHLTQLESQKIEVSSNYPGDWTLLLRERMFDPVTKEKFVQVREAVMLHMKQGEVPEPDGINLIKPKNYASHYQKQIDEYDENVERIFSKTHIGMAEDFGQDEIKLGSGSIGEVGNVFVDGQKDGMNLTMRQKNIIEAHEKGHGLRDFVTIDQSDFKHSIDFTIIDQSDKETGKRERGYLMMADEIAERMAQLKNYFGFNASDVFTKEHLAYVRENYIKDTELDNNMTTFLKAITENTTPKFLETINRYPL